jgi:TolB-like protein/class 3 adenylate cyclase/tetratricopeptide (TPR) repeat protein
VDSEQRERRLSAILAADVAGYSRLVGADEEGTLALWKAHWDALIDPKIREHHGRIVRINGDGILSEFASVVHAMRCAVEIQRGMGERNVDTPKEKRFEFRIGINVGDIIVDSGDIWGDGVNVAARLEALADPGGICVSARVREDTEGKLDIDFEDKGEQQLKNIARPIRVYRVRFGQAPVLTPALPDKPSIAVLPFENLSSDPEQECFTEGVVDDIITELSRIRWLFVIARNSSFTYKGRFVDVKQVARELGVRYVLRGSVRKAAQRVRVTAQLVDASTGHHVWASRYERELVDIFLVQDEIVDRVMAAIEPQLYAAEGSRAKRKPPESLDAWECVVRAIALMNARTREDATVARELLQKAIALDPNYAQAHSLLAFVLALGVHSGWEPRDSALALATDAAQRALRLDVDDPWTHAALGFSLVLSRRVADGVAEYERAVALNPNFAFGYTMLGAAYCYLGRGNDAMTQIDKAERLSPRDLLTLGNRGFNNVMRAAACLVASRYQEGAHFARQALVENPTSTPAWRQLLINCSLGGEIIEAKSALRAVKRLQPDISIRWIEEWLPFVRSEDRQKYIEGFRLAGVE